MLFTGRYFFLSTFYKNTVPFMLIIDGKECLFTNVEAAFQAQKVPEIADKFSLVLGLEAMKIGKQLKIMVPNWQEYQLYAMANALCAQYKNPTLLNKLKKLTSQIPIEYENYWGDTFWGISNREGKNFLGKLLMFIRENGPDTQKINEFIKNKLIPEIS